LDELIDAGYLSRRLSKQTSRWVWNYTIAQNPTSSLLSVVF
jgi:hypothetical protein